MDSATEQQNDRLKVLAIAAASMAALLIAIVAYLPGLSGPFLFDDFGTIVELGSRGGVTDWTTFKAFVFGGHSGPTGRPLAMMSFLIDANNWPADAWPFKRTNLVLHLVNGVLLGVLSFQVLNVLDIDRNHARWAALFSAATWLLHPFLVSTTLYVVQRMAQLSTMFMFVGLIGYLYGRARVAANAAYGYLVISLSVVLCTFFALVSKENGVLLPLLIGVVEVTLIASQRAKIAALNRYWAAVFIIAPALFITVYLGEKVFRDDFFDVVPPRDFSIYERVLSQPRVLLDYLRHWFVPELYTVGIFQDHYAKSTSLLSPVSTAFSAACHLILISLAIIRRNRWPLFAFAVLFFYASHVLESTVLNLELYFEHRNYLASAFLVLPPIVLLQRNVNRKLIMIVGAGLLLMLASFTRYSSTVWEDYASLVEASAQKAPTSARAQMLYATNLHNEKRYDESVQVIERAIRNLPNDQSLKVSRAVLLCNQGTLQSRDFDVMAQQISAAVYDPRSITLYTTLGSAVTGKRCPDVPIQALQSMFVGMLAVAENADPDSLRYSQIQYFIGYASAHNAEPVLAMKSFRESLGSRPGASHAMLMAAVMASNNYNEEALSLSELALEQLETIPRPGLQGARVSESDILEFRKTVRAEIDVAVE